MTTTTTRKARQGKLRTTCDRVETTMAHIDSSGDPCDVATIDAPNATLRAFDPEGMSANGTTQRRVFGTVSLHHVLKVEVRPTHVDNGTQIDVICDNGGHHGAVRYGITLFDLPLDVLAAAVAAAVEAQGVQS